MTDGQDPLGMPPAGWYPAPEEPGFDRWWDGSAWSDVRQRNQRVQRELGNLAQVSKDRRTDSPAGCLVGSSIFLAFILLGAVGLYFGATASSSNGVGTGPSSVTDSGYVVLLLGLGSFGLIAVSAFVTSLFKVLKQRRQRRENDPESPSQHR